MPRLTYRTNSISVIHTNSIPAIDAETVLQKFRIPMCTGGGASGTLPPTANAATAKKERHPQTEEVSFIQPKL